MGLRVKIAIYFLVISVLVFAAVLSVANQTFSQQILLQTHEQIFAIKEIKKQAMLERIEDDRKNIQVFSAFPEVVRALSSGEKLEQIFLNEFHDTHHYYDVFVIEKDGYIAQTAIQEADLYTNLVSGPYSDTPLGEAFQEVLATKKVAISSYKYYEPSLEPAAFLVAPVLQEGKTIGAVAFQLNVRAFKRVFSEYEGLGQTGEVVLGQEEGERIKIINALRHDEQAAFQRDIIKGSDLFLPIQSASSGIGGEGTYEDYRGEKVLAIWDYIGPMNWGIVVKIDEAEILEPIKDMRQRLVIIGLAASLVILILMLIVSARIISPINKLQQGIEVVESGNLHHNVEVDSKDEIGQLAQAFNRMIVSVRQSRAEVDQKVEKQTKQIIAQQKEMERTLAEAELLTKNMIDRELKMMDLKNEIRELKKGDS